MNYPGKIATPAGYACGAGSSFPLGMEVSWVGERPGTGELWFGSEDGKLAFRTIDDMDVGPVEVSRERDSVNGIAFQNEFTAVGTPSRSC